MSSAAMPRLSLFDEPNDRAYQFKLRRIQTFNWGTFPGIFDFAIPTRGYLFIGPSGSGKSTILDANAALMTPPKWVDFNVAAREAERSGKDRSLMTYVRGAWAQQTADSGEYVSQYLRPDTTWSAIAQTFRNGLDQVIVLAQVLWVRGKSTAPSDVRRYYLVLEREFDLHELQFFPAHDFDVRRFKFDLPDAFARDEFSAYQERFRRLLGIDNERALRLLHKTQSAKNLGDLNTFLRDFMLDPPETFELADKLVTQFRELDEAHRAVVDARRQIEVLQPARDEAQELGEARQSKAKLDELAAGVDAYREQRLRGLIEEEKGAVESALAGMADEEARLKGLADDEYLKLRALQDQRAGMGGSLLERLANEVGEAEGHRSHRMAKRGLVQAACKTMDWDAPETPAAFAERKSAAMAYVLDARTAGDALDERKFALKTRYAEASKSFEETKLEVAALERRRSNIPAKIQAIRERLSHALAIAEEDLPFAGELMEVKKEESAWQGAIERVLNSFAQSLLVADRHYSQCSAYLNENFLGERLVYFRVMQQAVAPRTVGPAMLIRKLNFATAAHAEWVREELKAHFDYECAETLAAFRNATRAVTKEGQVKHNATRHEKNDRLRVNDRGHWVLGFDNAPKLELYKKQAFDLAVEMEDLRRQIASVEAEGGKGRERLLACNQLSNMTWEEIDVASSLARIVMLRDQIEQESRVRPDLAKLDGTIAQQRRGHERAMKAQTEFAGAIAAERRRLANLQKRFDGLRQELLEVELTPAQRLGLDERFERASQRITLDTLADCTTQVVRAIGAETGGLAAQTLELRTAIERRFAEFIRTWAAEAGGLDATLASASDFFAKLSRLETDALPKYEARFLHLLREQSDQSLTRLSSQLDYERKAIRDRMGLVNESLATTLFGPGTHLAIETQDKLLEDVVAFKQSLRSSLSHTLSADPALAEKRFEVINALVKRFASQENEDRKWRATVLDVRQHVEFVARELDSDGIEVEVYRSGAGKSGGQRQKLAATCLAAALRYQLGGQDRALPRFSTVFLDEAFDKADAEFTTMAMNIFQTFGFQMIVATPLKSVMTLEPFIGGACFVHIKDRKTSLVVPIEYDDEINRLKWQPDDRHEQEAAAS